MTTNILIFKDYGDIEKSMKIHLNEMRDDLILYSRSNDIEGLEKIRRTLMEGLAIIEREEFRIKNPELYFKPRFQEELNHRSDSKTYWTFGLDGEVYRYAENDIKEDNHAA